MIWAEDEGWEMGPSELPPAPPRLPTPSWWNTLTAVAVCLIPSEFLFFTGTTKFELFCSGVTASLAGLVLTMHISQRHRTIRVQKDLDEGWAEACLRIKMVAKLIQRYGPHQAIESMTLAGYLVDDGDFPDIKQAVAHLERSNDLEPTDFD